VGGLQEELAPILLVRGGTVSPREHSSSIRGKNTSPIHIALTKKIDPYTGEYLLGSGGGGGKIMADGLI